MPDVIPLGRGRFQIVDGDRVRLAYAAIDGARTWVYLDGRCFVVDDRDQNDAAGRPTRQDDDSAALMAPMPATVLSIAVAPGDRVARGDLLMTLEAMKMELPIRATRGGTITAIACRAGEIVQPGIPLVEIEPEA